MEFEQLKRGRFIVKIEEKKVGHIDYTYTDEKTISLDSTEVEPDYRSQGIAKKLVLKAVEFAREHALKITPICPYTATLFKRMKNEFADVRA